MAKFVLGVGFQNSVRNVVRLAEQHLVQVEGNPRKVIAEAPGIRVSATRPELEGEFQSYTMRLSLSAALKQSLQDFCKTLGEIVACQEDPKQLVITCPAEGQAWGPAAIDALDKVSQQVSLPEVWHVSGDHYRTDRISVEMLFQAMIQYKASDVHLSPGSTPIFRVDGEARSANVLPPLSAVQIDNLIREIADERYQREFDNEMQTSFNFHQVGLGYSRVSAFIKNGSPHCTIRFLPEEIPSFDDLNIPAATMTKMAELHRGLLLVTGMTGSGKTTTVAALVDWINAHRAAHILTIENPVEYVHHNKKSVMSQRAIGTDAETFDMAVTGALRHDPDVIVIGEMRDPDTIRAAINAAATGHLVISTLHSNTAYEVINRVVSFFDPVERDLVRLQLRDCLKCVICQRLVPKIGGGRIPALEFLFNDVKAIGDGILEGDTDHIRLGMQQTVSHSVLFEFYLHRLYKDGLITLESAQEFASDQSMFDQIHMGTYSAPRLEGTRGH